MPDYDRSSDTSRDPRSKGDPHAVPWYWRLIQLFQRESHPISAEDLDDDGVSGFIREWWKSQFNLGSNRKERYRVYDEMDQFGLVQMVLDVYAEESTQQDYDRRQAVWIESKNANMVKRGEECLKNCQVEDRVTAIARFMCKYGDEFRRLVYQTKKGVLGWKHSKAKSLYRLEDKYSRLIGFREDGKKFRLKKRDISWPWDYVHFRLLGKDDEDVYGTSLLDGLFRSWRQLALTEDALLMYRLRRAPDRNMIMIDVGNMEEHEASEYVNAWRKAFRKFEFIDPASPQYAKQFNPLHPLEDIFFPKRGAEDNSSVDQLTGSGNVGEVYDLEHFRNAFFGSAKVPKAYGGFEGEINCFKLSTRIPCLDGRTRTLKQIVDEYMATGNLPWVYSYDESTKRVVPGKVTWAGVTREDAEVVEVELNDGTKQVCTPEHPWYTLDGNWVRAEDLEPGQQLLPLRRSVRRGKSYGGYEVLHDPFGGSSLTHLRVAENLHAEVLACMESPNVHHDDRRKRNNDPRNLLVLESWDHAAVHGKDRYNALTAYRQKHGAWNKGLTKDSGDPMADRLRQTTYLDLTCLNCGEPFRVPLMRRKKRFCSSACAGAWGARARVSSGRVLTRCQMCGGQIETVKSRIEEGKDRFCGRECFSAYCEENRLKRCEFCSILFDPGTKKHRRFCSKSCAMYARAKTARGDIPVPNHTVVAVRRLKRRYDTGDISVLHHHNFFVADRKGLGGVLVHNSKATLMQQDVRFARSCKRVQKALIYGLRQLLDIHFTLLPESEDDETYDFTKKENAYIVQMAPIAYLDEWERLELVQLRYQIVEAMSRLAMDMQLDPKVWAAYVLLNYAKLPEDLVLKLMSQTPSKPTSPGGGGGGFGGGFEGLDLSVPPVGVRIGKEEWKRLDEDTRRSIVEPIGSAGFYEVRPEEKLAIAKIIHESAPLRKIVGDIAEYHEEDWLMEQAKRQTDPSLLPPISKGVILEDDYDDDKEAKLLKEDMGKLKDGTLKDEKPTDNVERDDGDSRSVPE